jgi:hypothetical protein
VSPTGALTLERALPLYDAVLAFPAQHYVEGHHPAVTSRSELDELLAKARAAARGGATTVEGDDEDARYFADAFAAGRRVS